MVDEDSAPKSLTKNPLGATGKAVAANIERLRKQKNLTFVALSEDLTRLGRPIPPLGLRKIVAENRRVDADDLVAIAVVFNVSPASLLLPKLADVGEDDLVDVTGWHVPVTAQHVWRWLTATRPFVSGALGSFIDHALPRWERERQFTDAELRNIRAHDENLAQMRRKRSRNGDD